MLLILTKAWIIFIGRLLVPRPVRMFSVWPFQSLVGHFHNNFFVSSFNLTVWTYHPTFFFVSRVRSRRSKYHFHKLFGFPSSSLSGKWDSQSCSRKREIINMLIKTTNKWKNPPNSPSSGEAWLRRKKAWLHVSVL